MNSSPSLSLRPSWREALLAGSVWSRALRIGLPVGLMQAVINQGDHWLAHEFTSGVIVKSFLSPALSMSIALTAAASTYRLTGSGKNCNP
jgi:hypothetical protein